MKYITEKLNNQVYELSKEDLEMLYQDNILEQSEVFKNKNTLFNSVNCKKDFNLGEFDYYRENIEPKTNGIIFQHPHGIIIQQAKNRNFYRGENQIYKNSLPSLSRKLNTFESESDKSLYRLIADMRIAEFMWILNKFSIVKNWQHGDVLYDILAQHYGLETNWLDITSDFNVAMFFATNFYKDGKWHPLTKEETEIDEEHKYGMIFHMPSWQNSKRYSNFIYKYYSENMKNLEVGDIHYNNIIYQIGFQPFMRCHMQYGYGIYMYDDLTLQKDNYFEKLKFRHDEQLSLKYNHELKGGEKIYPHEGLNKISFLIEEIKKLTSFSEESFRYALYRSHEYSLEDYYSCKKLLTEFKYQNITIENQHPISISKNRKNKIEEIYKDFDIENYYKIKIMKRKIIGGKVDIIEPWMLPYDKNMRGVKDYQFRKNTNDCDNFLSEDIYRTLDTIKYAKHLDW